MHTTPRLWDADALKAHAQAASGLVTSAQAEQDWKRATIYVERALSDKSRHFETCRLPACRRARRCRGNPTVCLPPGAGTSAKVQAVIDNIYVTIQQQRRASVYDGRKLDLLDPVTRKLPGKR